MTRAVVRYRLEIKDWHHTVSELTMVNVDSDLVRLAGVGSTVVLPGLLGPTGPHHQVAAVVLPPPLPLLLLLPPVRPAGAKYFSKTPDSDAPLQRFRFAAGNKN